MADYRIKYDAKPYAGKRLLAVSETMDTVTGWVIISRKTTATALRTYKRTELVEIDA